MTTLCTIMHMLCCSHLVCSTRGAVACAEYMCVCVWLCKAQKYTHC